MVTYSIPTSVINQLIIVNRNHDQSTTVDHIKDETGLIGGRSSPGPSPRKMARHESPVQVAPASHSPLDKIFLDLPLELLLEIAMYLRPLDLIRLSRVGKTIHGLLVSRSASWIWRVALRAVDALPPISTDLPEALLAALLFLAECTICGKYTDEDINFFLQVKLCSECRSTDLVPATGMFAKLLFVSTSKHQGSAFSGTSPKLSNVCLRGDYDKIKSKHDALQATRNSQALKSWIDEQVEAVDSRSKSARLLVKWFKTWSKRRRTDPGLSKRERRRLTCARVADVDARMTMMGYQRSELRHLRTLERKKWREWVANSEPLDDHAWELILPHLLHHLEEYRKRLRRSERQPALNSISSRIQDRLKSISCIQSQFDIEEWALLSTSPRNSPIPESIDNYASLLENDITLPSFPHNNDIPLICPEVQAAMEAPIPNETFELEIQTKDGDIEHAAQAWRDVLELTLLNLLPADTRPAQVGTSEYKLIIGTGGDARPLDLLSVGCRKLLRADSIFCLGWPILGYSGERLLYYPEDFRGGFKMSDRTNLQYHSEATKIARALLCAIGLPDASYIAMNTVPRLYQCSRCEDKPIFYLWKELLRHYLIKAGVIRSAIQGWGGLGSSKTKDPDALMHDVDSVDSDKPLVQLVDAAVYFPALSATANQDHFVCLLCLQANHPADTHKGGDNIQYYFQNVHNINEPIEGVHYVFITPDLLFTST
ncbi:unnamed protein product [Rhizoctonia solani]|uniref:F-box domain-containing protein n=1 Tax=Rhizoctonia solani TaxID=456999 RepID=A0A8H3BBW1_9AGAM|nr:unnamed protein product [Rhizoctonia solani]